MVKGKLYRKASMRPYRIYEAKPTAEQNFTVPCIDILYHTRISERIVLMWHLSAKIDSLWKYMHTRAHIRTPLHTHSQWFNHSDHIPNHISLEPICSLIEPPMKRYGCVCKLSIEMQLNVIIEKISMLKKLGSLDIRFASVLLSVFDWLIWSTFFFSVFLSNKVS